MYYNAHKQVRPNQFEKSVNIFFFKRKWIYLCQKRLGRLRFFEREVSKLLFSD